MKYRIAKELIEKTKKYDEMDDLIVFKKPYNKTITFIMKDNTIREMNLKEYSYISLSNHGFLFITKKPYKRTPIHLNNVKDFIIR